MRNLLPPGFDWKSYIVQNPDLAEKYRLVTERDVIKYWRVRGYKLGRPYKINVVQRPIITKFDPVPVETLVPDGEEDVVVYTCISGQYDNLKEIKKREPGIRYICFTDVAMVSSTWEIHPIPDSVLVLDSTRRARCLKAMPHQFLPYNIPVSVWVDGNIEILGDIRSLVEETLTEDVTFATCYHPDRTCTYVEAEAVIQQGKDVRDVVLKQVSKYKEEGFPENYGLCQTGIILRKHLSKDVIKFGEEWWKEILTQSKRDQLSMSYTYWKYPNLKIKVLPPSLIVSKHFQIWLHKRQAVKLRPTYDSIQNYLGGKPL